MRVVRQLFLTYLLVGAILGFLGMGHLWAAYDSNVSGGGVKATLSSPFDTSSMPGEGAIPFRLEVVNESDQEQDCNVVFTPESSSDGSLSLTENLVVEAHSVRKFSVVLPVPIRHSTYSFLSIKASFSCRAVTDEFTPISVSRSNGAQLLAVVGNEVNAKIDWVALAKYRSDQSQPVALTAAVDPKSLSGDWKGYDGIGAVLLSDHEWLGLDADQRLAILDYVAMGGRLSIFSNPGVVLASLNLPLYELAQGLSPFQFHYAYRFGAGYIGLEDSKEAKAEEINPLFNDLLRKPPSTDDYVSSSWSLGRMVGTVKVNAPLIVSIVVLFATLVGPVNLLYFAPANNRFRLFWTTPLISLSASALLLFGILVADGWGGSGQQFIVVFSMPELNQELVMQEQACRTAVLLTTDWKLDDDAIVTQLPQQMASDGTRALSYDRYSVVLPERAMSGTWFRSRAISWQYLQTVRPSRSSLLLVNAQGVKGKDETPQLLSSFQEEMDEVHLHIGNKYWKAIHVVPGQRVTCTAETLSDWQSFLSDCRENAGPLNRDVLREPDVGAGGVPLPESDEAFFVATGVPTGKEQVNTLSSIRWQVDKEIYLGNLAVDKGESHP